MIDLPVFAAVAVVIGGVAAATARDGRVVVLGLMVAAVTSALVASPLPGSLAITARILGAILAAYLLWAAVASGSVNSAGSPLGLIAEASAALAAFAVGLAVKPVDPLEGPVVAQAAGFSMMVLAIAPLAGRNVFRMGVGVALLALGCSLLVGSWSGPTPALEQLALTALLVGIAGATTVLIPGVETQDAPAEPASDMPAPAVAANDPAPSRAAAPANSQPLRQQEPLPPPGPARRRPMTADPIEPDAWAAWDAPEPTHKRPVPAEPSPRKTGRSRRDPDRKP